MISPGGNFGQVSVHKELIDRVGGNFWSGRGSKRKKENRSEQEADRNRIPRRSDEVSGFRSLPRGNVL